MFATRLGLMSTKEDVLAVRRSILQCLFESGGGHYGGSLSVADILLCLYREIAPTNATIGTPKARDRVILSKGHAAAALYAVLKYVGLLKGVSLGDYGRCGAGLEGHPDMTQTEGVDFSSGSLGQGVSAGIGMALVLAKAGFHAWVIAGDGECQEGQNWEAFSLAARYRLSNLHVIIDLNRAQEIGWQHDLRLEQEPMPKLAEKLTSFDWEVHQVDGHDHASLSEVFQRVRNTSGRPSAILARTVKGKGVKLIESDPIRYHCTTLNDVEHSELMASLYA